MRLANGIVIDKEKTFGVLKFSALRREVHVQNEDGTVSEEIKERTYDLKCNTQGRMIQVSVPATVPLKDYDYNAEVELINPVADTVANANYRGADVDWYVKADDIVLKNRSESKGVDTVIWEQVSYQNFTLPLYPKAMISWVRLGNLHT